MIVDRFWVDLDVENLSKINEKSIQKAIENKMQVGMVFGWLLDGFLVDLGCKLGGKLGPSWHQNRRKWCTKTMSKNHIKFGDTSVRGESVSWPLRILQTQVPEGHMKH